MGLYEDERIKRKIFRRSKEEPQIPKKKGKKKKGKKKFKLIVRKFKWWNADEEADWEIGSYFNLSQIQQAEQAAKHNPLYKKYDIEIEEIS